MEEIEKEWDRIYRLYSPSQLPWETGTPSEDLVELIDKGEIEKGNILDICSGLGTHLRYLARKGFEVYGIDISPTAVEYAMKRCKEEGLTCHITSGNAADLKYPEKFFTFVFDRGCFHHMQIQDRENYIKGIYRVLRDNGKYYMACFSDRNGRGWNHFTEEQIRRYFEPYFKIKSIREIVHREPNSAKVYLFAVFMEKR